MLVFQIVSDFLNKHTSLRVVLLSAFIGGLAGLLAGTASAVFLVSLHWAGDTRDAHQWIIIFLPIAGFAIGAMYHYWGRGAEKGISLVIDRYHSPAADLPLVMAPLVLVGTLLTHLFGGSAGREGTAVQMGASLSDRFAAWLGLSGRGRQIALTAGVSAGFASVFGTPFAGAVFALELLFVGKMRYDTLIASIIAAFVGDFVCSAWGVSHTQYFIPYVPAPAALLLGYSACAAVLFGLAAMLFSRATHFIAAQSRRYISYPPLRPLIGGAVIILSVYVLGTYRFLGLGVPAIVESFTVQVPWYDSIAKLLYTVVTLGTGFKGGEVTPLFYIGATLGSALSSIIPLPVALLAGMGFVAVFSGASNTPIACTIMGMELFGVQAGLFLALACTVAYFCSGTKGIYGSQGADKYSLAFLRNKRLW